MASNVFPMLSSSPPPMDDCPEDEDDEDEFGNFTSALPYDSSFDSPVAINKIQQFNSCDKNDEPASSVLNKNPNSKSVSPVPQETLSSFSTDKESQKNGFIPFKDSLFKSSTVCNSEVRESKRNCSFDDSSHISSNSVLKTIINAELSFDSNRCEPDLNSENLETDLKSGLKFNNCTDSDASIAKFDGTDGVHKVENFLSENEGHVDQDSEHYQNNRNTSDNLCSDKISGQNHSSESQPERDFDVEKPAGLKTGDDLPEYFDAKCEIEVCSEYNERQFLKLNQADSSVVKDCQCLNYGDACSNPESNACSFVKDKDTLHSGITDSEDFDEFSDYGFVEFQSCNAQPAVDLKDQHHAEQSSRTDQIKPVEVVDSDLKLSVYPEDEFCDFTDSTSLNVLEESNLASQDGDLDDFADFQASSDCRFNDCPQNNDGAFADFQKAREPKTFDAEFSDFQGGDFREEDEFSDFQDFSKSAAPAQDEFADFSAVPFQPGDASQVEEESEFTDFAKAPPDTSSGSPSQVFLPQKPVDPLSTLINAVFPLPEESEAESDSDYLPSPVLEQSNKSRRLWEKLHEVEQVPSLRFQWGVSHTFQQLLRSVNVDYHSILRTSSVPIFASGLSLLEPVKGQAALGSSSESAHGSTRDPIPPVHFDWNSSGLINPLDSGQVDSSLMDLSFLSSVKTNSSSTTSSDHSFENELLRPSPDLPSPDAFRKPPVLEQLLSKNISSLPNSSFPHRPSNLSAEATLTLDQLPDLSFMQAKVLMFPIISNDT